MEEDDDLDYEDRDDDEVLVTSPDQAPDVETAESPEQGPEVLAEIPPLMAPVRPDGDEIPSAKPSAPALAPARIQAQGHEDLERDVDIDRSYPKVDAIEPGPPNPSDPCESDKALDVNNSPNISAADPQASEHGDGPCVAKSGTPRPSNRFETNVAKESDAASKDQHNLVIGDGSGRTRRIRKARTINLKACMCGIDVSEAEIEAGEKVLQCKVPGCETGWVCHDLQ